MVEQQVVTGLSRHMFALVHVPPALTTRIARGLVVVVVVVPFLLPFMVCGVGTSWFRESVGACETILQATG